MRSLKISDYFYDKGDEEDDDSDGDDDDNGDDETVLWSFPSVTSLTAHNTYPIPFHLPHLTYFKFRYTYSMLSRHEVSARQDAMTYLVG